MPVYILQTNVKVTKDLSMYDTLVLSVLVIIICEILKTETDTVSYYDGSLAE